MLRPGEPIIHDGNSHQYDCDQQVNGERKARGLVPRDYDRHPVGSYAGSEAYAVDMPTIPRSEWSARIKEMVETKSRLSDMRLVANNGQPIPSLDQNGQGYCWAYSTTMAVMMLRMVMNLPYVRLSAHATACIIKGYRDEGGWCGLSMERQMSHGTPSVQFWPEKSMSRSNDRPETWANAALHKVTEGWVDIQAAVYNRNLTFDQVMTCLLCRIPVAADFNHWGHSVCLLDPVEVEPGSFAVRGINSWTDAWGDRGMFVLQGGKAIPDGAVAPRVTGASLV
jgi:hypothetical protein